MRRRNAPGFRNGSMQEIRAVTRFGQRHPDVFVEGKDVQLREIQFAFGDQAINFKRRVATGDHDVARSRVRQPVHQAISRRGVGFDGGGVN